MTLFDNGRYRLCYYRNAVNYSTSVYNTIVIGNPAYYETTPFYFKTIVEGADYILDNNNDLTLEETLQLLKYKNELYNPNTK